MKKARTIRYLLLGMAAALVLSGCAYPISRQLRDSARDIKLPAVAENPAAYKGAVVIWGGRIIKTHNSEAGSDIYILGMPLNYRERPVDNQVTEGRFIARTKHYLDPALYEAGKAITVAGTIEGVEKHPVGDLKYPYPVVRIKEVHLWQPEPVYMYPAGWYGGGWYGAGWYGWWEPYWYGPPHIGPPYYYYYTPAFRFHWGGHHEMRGEEQHERHHADERGEHVDRK